MKRKEMKNWLCAALLVVGAGMGMTACSDDDYGYYDTEKSLFGEWETDTLDSQEPNGIILYHADIVPSDKHSLSPYRVIVLRKDGQWYELKRGTMGHRNEDPDDRLSFTDLLNSYGSFDITVSWLDKAKTRIALYDGMVFHRKSTTSCYDRDYIRDFQY